MANFYNRAERKAPKAAKAIEAECAGLDISGNGVCKCDGRVYFVDNLLPGERARIVPAAGDGASKDRTGRASVSKMLSVSSERVEPTCALQSSCGGCPLSHMKPDTALSAKVEGVAALLRRSVLQGTTEAKSVKVSSGKGLSRFGRNSTIKQALARKHAEAGNAARAARIGAEGKAAADAVARPAFIVRSEDRGYRRACRLAVRADHGKLHTGFRAAGSQNLVPVKNCEVLSDRLNALLEPVQKLINALRDKKNIGHVELLDSDGDCGVLLRMTSVMCPEDCAKLVAFGHEHGAVISLLEPYRQLDDSEVVRERVLNEGDGRLYVRAGECEIGCSPSSFVQINAAVNAQMIEKVLEAVSPREGQKVLDLFCGLGNFSLPVAHKGSNVTGIDIVSDMVRRANKNAEDCGLADRAVFRVADLESPFESQIWAGEKYDVVIMDPGRAGARRAVTFMSKLKPARLVMISCNPNAAARDCVQLLSDGFRMESWGVFDMFPRTAHVEIMMVFVRDV